ncbi:MAG: leucine-rich repeat protein, partial [Oscillospiraceae bacterium]|nr:leucine-rich repeat protein [Oscillospiraceae bacterium]
MQNCKRILALVLVLTLVATNLPWAAAATELAEAPVATETTEPVEATEPVEETTESAETEPAQTPETTVPVEPVISTVEVQTPAVAATTASGTCGDNLTWTLDADGVLTISGTGPMDDYVWYSDGETPWLYLSQNIYKVVIMDGVTSIGTDAFAQCENLTQIDIADSVVSVGHGAFEDCESLEFNAYKDCWYVGNANNPYMILVCPDYEAESTLTIHSNTKVIAEYAFEEWGFEDCAVVIPDSVTHIGYSAFYYSSGITSITVGSGVTHIGTGAFAECYSLEGIWVDEDNANYSSDEHGVLFNKDKTVLIAAPYKLSGSYEVPAGVVTIADYAFYYCEDLKEISVPVSVTTIKENAFEECVNLATVHYSGKYADQDNMEIDNGNDCLLNAQWHCNDILEESVNGSCEDNLTWTLDTDGTLTISGTGSMEFVELAPWNDYRLYIKKVVIEQGVTSVGENAFELCKNLQEVTIPQGVTQISAWAFDECVSLRSIVIPDSVTVIGHGAFYGCTALTEVKLSATLPYIYNYVFAYCSGLKSIDIPDTVTSIGTRAFNYCTSLKEVNIPASVEEIGEGAFYGCGLTAINIPGTVKTIGDFAFALCQEAVTLVIGDGVSAIGGDAFHNCYNVEEVTIPKSVTSIGDKAFAYCYGLTGITVDPENATYSSDDHGVLFNKDKTELIMIPYLMDGGYVIPDGVVTIAEDAIHHRYYQDHIVIPASVKHLECMAIDPYEPAHILYKGTETQWKQITLGMPDSVDEYDEEEIDAWEGILDTLFVHFEATGEEIVFDEDCRQTNYCTLCGTYTMYYDEPTPMGHEIGEWTVYDEPDCINPGSEYRTCYHCDWEETREIPANGEHDYVQEDYGDYTYYYCVICGHSYQDGIPMPEIAVEDGALYIWSNSENVYCEIYRSTSEDGEYTLVGTVDYGYWQDRNVTLGKTYYYKVRAVSLADENITSEFTDAVSIVGRLAMPIVQWSNDKSTGKPILSWDKVSGAKKYEVWRYDSKLGDFKRLTTTTKRSYKDTKAPAGLCIYRIRAIGSKSAYNSAYTMVYTLSLLPTPTLKIKVDAATGKPVLSWSKVSGAAEYVLFRIPADDPAEDYKEVLLSEKAREYRDDSARIGVEYTYELIAFGSGEYVMSGSSGLKTEVCTLARPVVKTDITDNGKPMLYWEAIEGAQSYVIYKSTSSSKSFKKIENPDGDGATTFVDQSVAAGKTYYYKVVAVADGLKSAETSAIKLTGKCDIPVVRVETDTSGKPKLTWDKIPGAKKYEIRYSTDGGETFAKKTITTTKASYVHTGAASGKSYVYQVRALGSKSSYHGQYCETTQPACDVVCAAPSLTVKINTASGNPELTWKKVTGAAYYEIWRAYSADGMYDLLDTTDKLTFADDYAVADQTYYYYVIAVGEGGNFRSMESTVKSATAKCGQPDVKATIDNVTGKPVLTWEAVDDAVAYNIYRATSSSASKFKKVYKTVVDLSFKDDDVAAGKTYYYKVTAVSAAGKEGTKSSYDKASGRCAVPTGVNVEVDEATGKPVISWDKIPGAKKYEIRYSTDGENFKKLTTTTKCSYTHTGAKVGTTYTYKVRGLGSRSSYDGQYSGCVSGGVTVFAQPAVTVQLSS